MYCSRIPDVQRMDNICVRFVIILHADTQREQICGAQDAYQENYYWENLYSLGHQRSINLSVLCLQQNFRPKRVSFVLSWSLFTYRRLFNHHMCVIHDLLVFTLQTQKVLTLLMVLQYWNGLLESKLALRDSVRAHLHQASASTL